MVLRGTARYYKLLRVVLRVTMRHYEKFKVLQVLLRVNTKYYERLKVLRVVF